MTEPGSGTSQRSLKTTVARPARVATPAVLVAQSSRAGATLSAANASLPSSPESSLCSPPASPRGSPGARAAVAPIVTLTDMLSLGGEVELSSGGAGEPWWWQWPRRTRRGWGRREESGETARIDPSPGENAEIRSVAGVERSGWRDARAEMEVALETSGEEEEDGEQEERVKRQPHSGAQLRKKSFLADVRANDEEEAAREVEEEEREENIAPDGAESGPKELEDRGQFY